MVAPVSVQVRRGAYYDSVVLMQLQKALIELPAVLDAGVVMGTPANLELLQQSGLLTTALPDVHAEDLVIAVRAESDQAAESAIAQIDHLLSRRAATVDSEFHPRSLESALSILPEAHWVLVSVPGRFAAKVARDALDLHRHVFLYSDNVLLDHEIELKQFSKQQGLLVMGPDCGTAIINGIGLGFANRVRRGRIGLVAASGTGLQAVTVRMHNLGAGVSQAIGTGTRDLSDSVGAIATRQALAFLMDDPQTDVIVLISKPPSPSIAELVLNDARAGGKPVVVDFIGYDEMIDHDGNLYFVSTLDEAARVAVALNNSQEVKPLLDQIDDMLALPYVNARGCLRGLYSGGTLAYEAQLILRDYLPAIYSNAPLDSKYQLPSPQVSQENTVIDLGAEEFMIGRLHPMIDNDLRIRRLAQEANDPTVAVILLDVVLGLGSHPDPASELAPAIASALATANRGGRSLQIIAVVIGTAQDPQNYSAQAQRLKDAGAIVMSDHAAAVRFAGNMIEPLKPEMKASGSKTQKPEITYRNFELLPRLQGAGFENSFGAINVGLESFYNSLKLQNAPAVHVDWRPPAGGNEKLIAILERLKK